MILVSYLKVRGKLGSTGQCKFPMIYGGGKHLPSMNSWLFPVVENVSHLELRFTG
jgi:hypothetical protein